MNISNTTTLGDERLFLWLNGLWTGKRPPFTRAAVIRNTNFAEDGRLDLSDVAVLDVEVRQLQKRTLQVGDIILERSGGGPKQPVGRVCYFHANGPLAFSFSNFTSALRVVDKTAFHPRFVHYFLLHMYKDGFTVPLQRATTGLRNLDFDAYLSADIPQPPIEEQQEIATLLHNLERAVDAEQRVITTARDLKASAMRQIFTGGVRGETRVDTPLGPLPASWNITTIRENVKLVAGGTPARARPDFWLGGDIPWVKTGEIDYSLIAEAEERITQTGLENSAAKILPKGTLLIAMYGQGVTRGKVAMLGIDAATNQACVGAIPKTDDLIPTFLYHYLSYSYESLRSLSHGANQQNLNAELIGSFRFPLPPKSDQEEVVRILDTLDRKIRVHERKSDVLKQLFATLLHELMTGNVQTAHLGVDVAQLSI